MKWTKIGNGTAIRKAIVKGRNFSINHMFTTSTGWVWALYEDGLLVKPECRTIKAANEFLEAIGINRYEPLRDMTEEQQTQEWKSKYLEMLSEYVGDIRERERLAAEESEKLHIEYRIRKLEKDL